MSGNWICTCYSVQFTSLGRGTKRQFTLDSTAVEKLAQEAEEAGLRQIDREQAAALRNQLPSLTPTYTSSGLPSSLADFEELDFRRLHVTTPVLASAKSHSKIMEMIPP